MDCTCSNLISGLGVLGQRRGMVSNTKFPASLKWVLVANLQESLNSF